MPIYEYRCKECQQVFEEWCKHIEDDSVSHACPICKGEAERLISNTSFALKGGGWYVTEYGSRKPEGSSCSQSSPSTDSGTTAGTDTAATPPAAPAAAPSAATGGNP